MSAYGELAQQVREPMRDWWIRKGVWWLIGLTVAQLITQSVVTYIAVSPAEQMHSSPWQDGIEALGWVTGLIGAIGVPLIWLLAALAVTRNVGLLPTVESSSSPVACPARALFLVCLKQGLWPLLSVWCSSVAAQCATGYWLHPVTFGSDFYWPAVEAANKSLSHLLPVVLVALALLAVVRRPQLSLGLILMQGAAATAWAFLNSTIFPRHSRPNWWFVLVEMALGAAVLGALFYGLLNGRKLLWRSAYWTLIASLLLAPVLYDRHYWHGASSPGSSTIWPMQLRMHCSATPPKDCG